MVAMDTWPTDLGDGSVANEARWRKMARYFTPTGVLPFGGRLTPSLAGTTLTVQAGQAWVDGHFAELPAVTTLPVGANGITVVRFDPVANTASLEWRSGVTVPAQSPTGVYEMLVCSITASVLTDRRPMIYGSPGCRIRSSVGTPPLTSGTSVQMQFDIEDYDSGDFHDAANNGRITIPAGLEGIYTVGAYLSWGNNTPGSTSIITIQKNNSIVLVRQDTRQLAFAGTTCSWTGYLASGDFLTMAVWQNGATFSVAVNAGAYPTDPPSPLFECWRVAPN
jgi:hypothetical protein